MAYLPTPKTPEDVKKTPVSQIRTDYNKLADVYNQIVDHNLVFCKKCGRAMARHAFYDDSRYADGLSIFCKDCIRKIAYQQKKDTDPINETPASIREALKVINKPFKNSIYNSAKQLYEENSGERDRKSIFTSMVTTMCALPQYRNLTYDDSDVLEDKDANTEEFNIDIDIIKAGRKRFGDYPESDLMFLEQEYEDWISRYPCDSKSQELLFQRLCCQLLDANKAQKSGAPTKDIDKAMQETMAALGIKPSQSKADAMADNMTFGMLIDKWESSGKPIPEPEDEFKDVDKIGTYIDVFFKGHLSKSMGLKNGFSQIYDKFMKKYTVKPQELDDEQEEILFNQIFGSKVDGD